MTPADCLRGVIRPALAQLPERFRAENAERMLIAIALQESALQHRIQRIKVGGKLIEAPHLARGIYQFELIGVKGVLAHPTTQWLRDHLARYKNLIGPAEPRVIHDMLARSDFLATWVARGLLWTHPDPLPQADQRTAAWDYYRGLWRPGKPRPAKWPENWRQANAACDECRVLAA